MLGLLLVGIFGQMSIQIQNQDQAGPWCTIGYCVENVASLNHI